MMKQDVEITAVIYGETEIPESMAFWGGSSKVFYPIKLVIYVVRTENNLILIDAGCDTMPGFPLRNFISPAAALKGAGFEPEQITDIIVTHAHHDHIDGVRHFSNAVIHIQQEEYSEGKHYIPDGFRVQLFEKHCTVAGCLKVCRFGGHSQGSCIVKLNRNGTKYVFSGDECYLQACLDRKLPTGASCRPEISRYFVETYSKDEYKVLLSHDPGIVPGLVK